MRRVLSVMVFVLLVVSVRAQDPVAADPQHYTVVSENEDVRVLRIRLGPREKSVLHEHARGTVVMLTDLHLRNTTPDGKFQDIKRKAGDVLWASGGLHLPENLSDAPAELIYVEIKGAPPADTARRR